MSDAGLGWAEIAGAQTAGVEDDLVHHYAGIDHVELEDVRAGGRDV
jgi:hypothetical protein